MFSVSGLIYAWGHGPGVNLGVGSVAPQYHWALGDHTRLRRMELQCVAGPGAV